MLTALFHILIFPGFLFLSVYALLFSFVDRKIYARLQNRVGPPWYQPLADFLKLLVRKPLFRTMQHAGFSLFYQWWP